jgi:flagellar basal-body rod modification protein FlgD
MMQVTAATSGGSSAGLPANELSGTDDFMTLLVAQLKAQDPMNPMDPSEFMTQLAQLQSVAELQGISDLLSDASLGDAVDLIGRDVQWLDQTTGELREAAVERVEISDGDCRLIAGDTELALEDVLAITA